MVFTEAPYEVVSKRTIAWTDSYPLYHDTVQIQNDLMMSILALTDFGGKRNVFIISSSTIIIIIIS